jgi:gas vesicle protein GvpL/GvpF
MTVIAYCIAEAQSDISIPKAGVHGAPIKNVLEGCLQGFASQFDAGSVEAKTSFREAALEFHHTIQEMFRQAAVLPFRFPTVLANEGEIAAHMSEHSSNYAGTLSRLRNSVQMEIRIEKKAGGRVPAGSGIEYLHEKKLGHAQLQATATQFRHASEAWLREWREHETSHGLHCYVLLPREHVDRFLIQVKTIVLPENHSARVSGPWPATEFFKAPR